MQKYFKQALVGLTLLSAFGFCSVSAQNSPLLNRDFSAIPAMAKTNFKSYYTDNQLCQAPVVIEFFSYGCPGCLMADQKFEEWLKTKPKNINFKRMPVNFHEGWDILAKVYFLNEDYGITEQLHTKLFAWMQTRKDPMVAVTVAEIKDFITKEFAANPELSKKVSAKQYINSLSSTSLEPRLKRSMEMLTAYGLQTTPSVAINNQYTVSVSQAQTLDNLMSIINQLVTTGSTSCS